MILMSGGLSLGVLLCLGLVHLLTRTDPFGYFFSADPPEDGRPPLAHGTGLEALFNIIDNPFVAEFEKNETLDRILVRAEADIPARLITSFFKKQTLFFRRRILQALTQQASGIRIDTLLLELLCGRAHAQVLRLDAAAILLRTGSQDALEAVKKMMKLHSEEGSFKAGLIDILSDNMAPDRVPVLIAALRITDMQVRAAALRVFKAINGYGGEKGAGLREEVISALAHSIAHSAYLAGIKIHIRLLVEAEVASTDRNTSPATVSALQALILSCPLDNPVAEEVVGLVAESIGRIGITRLIPELKSAMYGPSDHVRRKAVGALEKLGVRNMVPEMAFIANHDLLARIRKAAIQTGIQVPRLDSVPEC